MPVIRKPRPRVPLSREMASNLLHRLMAPQGVDLKEANGLKLLYFSREPAPMWSGQTWDEVLDQALKHKAKDL